MNTLFDMDSKEMVKTDLFNKFVDKFNEIRKEFLPQSRGIQPTKNSSRSRLREILKVYSMEDLERMIRNVFEDDFHSENNWKWITPDYVLRETTLQRFIDAEIKPNNDEGGYEYIPQ